MSSFQFPSVDYIMFTETTKSRECFVLICFITILVKVACKFSPSSKNLMFSVICFRWEIKSLFLKNEN